MVAEAPQLLPEAEVVAYDSSHEEFLLRGLVKEVFDGLYPESGKLAYQRSRIALAALKALAPDRETIIKRRLESLSFDHQERPGQEVTGHIRECAAAGCGTVQTPWACCSVEPGASNSIFLVAGELIGSGGSNEHLTKIDDSNRLASRWSCDHGCDLGKGKLGRGCGPDKKGEDRDRHKPLDCGYYPWFPSINGQSGTLEMYVAQGTSKCTLPALSKLRHLLFVLEAFNERLHAKPFWAFAYMDAIEGMDRGPNGYRLYDPTYLERLEPAELKALLRAAGNKAAGKAITSSGVRHMNDAPEAVIRYANGVRKDFNLAATQVDRKVGVNYSTQNYLGIDASPKKFQLDETA